MQLHGFIFCHLSIHGIRMHYAHEMLRSRWGVDCMLGMLSHDHLFLNDLTLCVEESQTLVESNKMTLLSVLGKNVNCRY